MAVQNFGSGGGGFQLSPGVNISEVDLTTVVPAVDTTAGAFAGVFRWGPVNEPTLVTSENDLVAKFGKPTSINPETFFTAANFLAYSNALYVARAANTSAVFAAIGGEAVGTTPFALTGTFNVSNTETTVTGAGTLFSTQLQAGDTILGANGTVGQVASIANNISLTLTANAVYTVGGDPLRKLTATKAALTVYNNDDKETKVGTWDNTNVQYIARWAGALGNSLKVSVCENASQYNTTSTLTAETYVLGSGAGGAAGNTAVFNGANTGLNISVGSSVGTMTLDGGLTSTGYDASGTIFRANSSTGSAFTSNAAVIFNKFNIGDYLVVGSGSTQALKIINKSAINVPNTGGIVEGVASIQLTFDQPLKLAGDVSTTSVNRVWEYFSQVDSAPGRSDYVTVNGNTAQQLADASTQLDEVHVVVVDEDGQFTGNPGTVLEVFQSLSRATDAKLADGTTNYYKNVINDQSRFVWAAADRSGAASNTALNVNTSTNSSAFTVSLRDAIDQSEDTISFSAIATAYDQFVSPEDIDISLLMAGRARGGTHGEQLPNYIIDNIAETRKDCVVFVSPAQTDVVNAATPETSVVEFRNALRSSSYAVLDSGYKQLYDKYNDTYRWVPLNGDIAGLCVRTDRSRDPWYSPAGTSRGQIKNVIKLAFNPNKAQRDLLYKNGVNPVISEPGAGPILFGDKTLLSKPSAFDRIGVRRLFIVLEKAISDAAKALLFEFNDEFTRGQFRNLVEPFLRDVQGRRGIYDFRVVCDETNNTPEIVDSNRFVGDIYIKPARSINFIQLNFVAVRSGIEFSEIVG